MPDEVFSIVFNYGTKEKPTQVYERIDAGSLIELCSKFVLLVAKVAHQITEKKVNDERFKNRNYTDDDIPF